MKKFSKKNNLVLISTVSLLIIILIVLFLQNSQILQNRDKSIIGKAIVFVKNINSPQGLTLGADDNLFTQSFYDGKISIIDKDGKAFDYIFLNNYFCNGIEIDEHNNILIATGTEVIIINDDGELLQSYKGFINAYDIEIAPDNTIFVSDSKKNTIYKISPQGKITTFIDFDSQKSAIEANVTGICFDREFKNLYAVNMCTGNLYKISLTENYEAKEIKVIASSLKSPNYIDIDGEGNIYITCLGDDNVVRVDQNSIVEVIQNQDKLSVPSGIVVIDNDNSESILYIASRDSNCIYKINLDTKNKSKK